MKEGLQPPVLLEGHERFGPEHVVLVMDTSFLIPFNNRNLWAYSLWFGVKKRAREEGKIFQFFILKNVGCTHQSFVGIQSEMHEKTLEFPLIGDTRDRNALPQAGDRQMHSAAQNHVQISAQRFDFGC